MWYDIAVTAFTLGVVIVCGVGSGCLCEQICQWRDKNAEE